MNRLFILLAALAGVGIAAPSTARFVLIKPPVFSTPEPVSLLATMGSIEECSQRTSFLTGVFGGLVVSITAVACYEVWDRKIKRQQ